jgi:hypothetical protein
LDSRRHALTPYVQPNDIPVLAAEKPALKHVEPFKTPLFSGAGIAQMCVAGAAVDSIKAGSVGPL